jgi:hypothetical protein
MLLVGAVAVVGCDGGDGDDDGSGVESETLLSLSASNAEVVSSEVVASWGLAFELPILSVLYNPVHPILVSAMAGLTEGSLAITSGITGLAVPLITPPIPLRQIPAQTDAFTVRATISETVPCPAGGTIQLSGAITSDLRLTVGDTLTSVYTNCMLSAVDGPINGTVGATITEVSGDPTLQTVPYGYRVDSQFAALSMTMLELGTFGLNGDVAWRNGSLDGIVFEDRVESQSVTLTLSGAPNPADDGSGTLSTYWVVLDVNMANPDLIGYSIDGSGAVASTTMGGTVTHDVVSDLTGFMGVAGTGYPEEGSAVIRGGYDSSILLTVLSDTQVRLDVDQSGDGVSDATLVVEWSDLFPESVLFGL